MQVEGNVIAYLQAEKNSCPKDLTEFYIKFEDLYDKKLWHQLTLQVEEFVQQKSSLPLLISLYQNFIADWQGKMNRISLVRYASKASRQLKGKPLVLQKIQRILLLFCYLLLKSSRVKS